MILNSGNTIDNTTFYRMFGSSIERVSREERSLYVNLSYLDNNGNGMISFKEYRKEKNVQPQEAIFEAYA